MIRQPRDTVRSVIEKREETAMEKSVTLEMIRDAREALKGVAEVTPVVTSKRLGTNLFIKSENLQKTGSFKIRGAYNKIRHLTPEEASRCVIACSAGNHAQGVALSATRLGIKSVICMPEGAPILKVLGLNEQIRPETLRCDDRRHFRNPLERLSCIPDHLQRY